MTGDIELRHLRYFVAIAEELSFTRAARRLSIAQPSLSLQIRQVETRLGTPLFIRQPRVTLTAAGRTLLTSARQVLRRMQQTLLAAERIGAGKHAVLEIGMASSAALTALPAVLKRFAIQHPQVDLRIREMHSADQFDALRTGLIDAGISREVVPEPPFVIHELLREPLQLVVPPEHRLARRRAVRLADCGSDAFVLFPRATAPMLYDQIQAACHEAGFSPRVEIEAQEWHTIAALVAAGFGLSIAPGSVGRLRIRGAVMRPIRPMTLRAALFLCYSAESASPALRSFSRFVGLEMPLGKGPMSKLRV
jgi:DNA-binding transcriptional LysR family regulator